jgi:hypothetical protein
VWQLTRASGIVSFAVFDAAALRKSLRGVQALWGKELHVRAARRNAVVWDETLGCALEPLRCRFCGAVVAVSLLSAPTALLPPPPLAAPLQPGQTLVAVSRTPRAAARHRGDEGPVAKRTRVESAPAALLASGAAARAPRDQAGEAEFDL